MSADTLVATSAGPQSTTFSGAYLLQGGADLANAIENGDWVMGGVAAFTTVLDGVGAVIDPIGTLLANGLGWVLDHIEPLRGWLEQLTGNAAEVQAFAQTWANVSSHLQQVGSALNQRLGDLEGLSGETVTAYRAHVKDLSANISGVGSWAGAVGSGLQIASVIVQAVYELVRDAISQVVGVAISAAITTVATVGFGAPAAIGQIVTKVSSLVGRVSSFVTKLLRSMSDLAPLLRQLTSVVDEVGGRLASRLNGMPSPVLAMSGAPGGGIPGGRLPSGGGTPGGLPGGGLPGGGAPGGGAPDVLPLSSSRLGGDTPTPDGWRPLSRADIDDLPVVRDGSHMDADGRLTPDTWYRTGEHEYIYHTDENGYIDRFHADELQLKTHEGRLPHDGDSPGKLPGDHAGHLAGDLFGGSPKLDNIVSQLSSINLSDYRKMEIQWADALRADPPGTVSVDVRITTDATGRPTTFVVDSIINGEPLSQTLRQ